MEELLTLSEVSIELYFRGKCAAGNTNKKSSLFLWKSKLKIGRDRNKWTKSNYDRL